MAAGAIAVTAPATTSAGNILIIGARTLRIIGDAVANTARNMNGFTTAII
jgi:hypothetical protein